MFCQKCGTQLNSSSLFCDKCGFKVNESDLEIAGLKSKTKEEWMLESVKEKLIPQIKAPSSAKFYGIKVIEEDKYGKLYVEFFMEAQNEYGTSIRNQYAAVLYNVSDDGLCGVVGLGPQKLENWPGFRRITKRLLKFGKPLK